MQELINKWRYYGLGKEEYQKCMKKMFIDNLKIIYQINLVAAILALICSIFPFLVEKSIRQTAVYLSVAVIAISVYFFTKYKYKHQNQRGIIPIIYAFILEYYTVAILFGVFLGVWADTDRPAVVFMYFILCAMFLFNVSPQFHLYLILGALAVFIPSSIISKHSDIWIFDTVNAIIAGGLGLIFNWNINMNRMSLASAAGKLAAERNRYYDQSTVDELTQLKNRRDFMETFKRYLVNYRQTDNYLCIALLDLDFFKNYNDHYGHPEGDECLRKIGKALNDLSHSMNIYAARIGGEEFALIWFETDAANFSKVPNNVMLKIEDLKIPHEKSGVSSYVTVSIGIQITKCGSSSDVNELYTLADKALYTAKKNGRNQIFISS
jgi:diguanylate cyclase (GGDEF)-like protein